jgi:anti-sigma regulatory factor (Ser/Thr protein kinase)
VPASRPAGSSSSDGDATPEESLNTATARRVFGPEAQRVWALCRMKDEPTHPERLAVDFDGDPQAPARIRAAVRRYLASQRPELCDEAQLVVSELTTNVVRHTSGGGALRIEPVGDSGLRIEVHDGSRIPPEMVVERRYASGLGMVVIDRLAQHWGYFTEPGGKCVWAELA